MVNMNLRLVPAERKFGTSTPRGKYPSIIRKFLASGESEMKVEAPDLQTAYLGLRGAVSNMGYKSRVYVKRQDGEIHLIRLTKDERSEVRLCPKSDG